MRPSALGTIPRLVLDSAERYAGQTALEEDGRSWSFADVAREGLRSARAFLAAGLEPGDRVGVWAPNGSGWIFASIGLQMAGGVLVPLNTRFKGSEAGYILRKSRARILVTVGEFLGAHYLEMLRGQELPDLERRVLLEGSDPGAETFAAFLAAGEAVAETRARERAAAVHPGNLADILFTSGTTGRPKGVMSTHEQDLRGFEAWTEVVGLRAGDRYLIVNPFFHAFGYKAGWLSCILRGATILPHAVFDVPAILARIGA